jgi:hypothetical protein
MAALALVRQLQLMSSSSSINTAVAPLKKQHAVALTVAVVAAAM